jgi:hypothetical protein
MPRPTQESLTNFAINSTAVAVLGFLVWRDLQEQVKVRRRTEREEGLGRLLVRCCAAEKSRRGRSCCWCSVRG